MVFIEEKIKKEIFERDKYKCKYCDCNYKLFLNIDHIIPLNKGGTNDKKNLTTCCVLCNKLKSDMTTDEFNDFREMLTIMVDKKFASLDVNNINATLHLPKNLSGFGFTKSNNNSNLLADINNPKTSLSKILDEKIEKVVKKILKDEKH